MRPTGFDFKHPDYAAVWKMRLQALERIRADPACIPDLKAFYKENPAYFIDDWGVTFDPRLVEVGLPGTVPMVLFDKQWEMVDWIIRKWKAREPGLLEKSRDCGASYVAVGLGCTLCIHYDGMAIGMGSRKAEYVDKIEEPKSLFWKARLFMKNLPVEFRAGWEEWRDAPHMRMNFPHTGSKMTGESGDQIGRGDRAGIYFVDEAAHLERPKLIEASLSQTTNCRIDMSSVNGMGNPFAEKRHSGRIDVFVFDWRDDPRKDQAWYEKQQRELDPVILAQEVDRDYAASVEGIVIPGLWVRACIDAHIHLGIKPTGARVLALDVADEGVDKNAGVGGQGILVDVIEEWSGKGSDTFATAQRAFDVCDDHELSTLRYDADGLGAFMRGDGRIINERRGMNGQRPISIEAFRGSDGVFRPESEDVKGRKNKDYFQNRKAQGWWALRTRIQKTYRWRVEGVECDPDEIVSISSKAKNYLRLVSELSQPTYGQNTVGKMVINKTPDGMKSPNLADACMMRYAPLAAPLAVSQEVLKRAAMIGARASLPGGIRQRARGRIR